MELERGPGRVHWRDLSTRDDDAVAAPAADHKWVRGAFAEGGANRLEMVGFKVLRPVDSAVGSMTHVAIPGVLVNSSTNGYAQPP